MDNEIKSDKVQISKSEANELKETSKPINTKKTIIAEDVYDFSIIADTDLITEQFYEDSIKRRPAYPWETNYSLKKTKPKQKEITDETVETEKTVITETEIPRKRLKRAAKLKNVREMAPQHEPVKIQARLVASSQATEVTYGYSDTRVRNKINRYEPTSNQSSYQQPMGKSTAENQQPVAERKKLCLQLLKRGGLNPVEVAGIFGNFHKETGGGFSPTAHNKRDTNGYPSMGLAQWNGKFFGKSKNPEVIFNVIGRTIPEQINYCLTKWRGFRTYRQKVAGVTSPGHAGYLFARVAEICWGCNLGEKIYYSEKKYRAYERSSYAIDYHKRFNNPSDPLYWNKN